MLCYKTVGKNANFAVKGTVHFVSRMGTAVQHTCSIHTSDRNLKQNNFNFKGHVLSNLVRTRFHVPFDFVRGVTTSGICWSVHIDTKKNYYHILGVTTHCSDAKIKQAYYRLSKVYHPDVNKTKAAILRFHEIAEAYEVLSSPDLKHIYDTGRIGKLHGIHRGTVNPHPVNFDAKGPHQTRKTIKKAFDDQMESRYRKTFNRFHNDLKKHKDSIELYNLGKPNKPDR